MVTDRIKETSLGEGWTLKDSESDVAPGMRHSVLKQLVIGLLLLGIGTAFGALLASLPLRARTGGPGSWRGLLTLFGIGSLTWYVCILTSPLYFWLARRFPIDRKNWRKGLTIHFAVTTSLVLITAVVFFALIASPMLQPTGFRGRAGPPGFSFQELGIFLMLRLLTESWQFWLMIALIHAYEFHRRDRQRELQAARLQAQLTQTRLEALTAQLHPHFLFNTLQGISTLMHRDVKAADAMLSGLSELLRQALQRGQRQEVPLSEELEVLSHYVSICCERFNSRLIFNTNISAEMYDALVPFFILQPLVENALEHGIARRAGIGRVQVNAERQDNRLSLSVTDDGPVIDAQTFPAEGIGLSNTRQRLRQLYGEQQSLLLETPADGGLRVILTIPYKTLDVSDKHEVQQART